MKFFLNNNLVNNAGFIALLIIVLILLVTNIIIIRRNRKTQQLLKVFMTGKDIKSMEFFIKRKFKDIETIAKAQSILDKNMKELMSSCGGAIQKIGVVKYNADEYIKGNASFAIAMMDFYDNGFIINSVNNGNICYNYFKEIENGKSPCKLSDEEALAISYAKESIVKYPNIKEA